MEYVLQYCVLVLESSTVSQNLRVDEMLFYERIIFVVAPWRVPGREEATRGYLWVKFIGI
jgi:hypothetical protein